MIDVVRQQQQQDAATVPTVPAVRSVRLRNAESGVCTAVPLYVVHADEDVPEELRLAFQDAVVLHVDANDASKASLSSLNGTLRLQHDEVDVMSPVVTVEGSVVTSAAGAEAGIESDLACSDLFDEFEARNEVLRKLLFDDEWASLLSQERPEVLEHTEAGATEAVQVASHLRMRSAASTPPQPPPLHPPVPPPPPPRGYPTPRPNPFKDGLVGGLDAVSLARSRSSPSAAFPTRRKAEAQLLAQFEAALKKSMEDALASVRAQFEDLAASYVRKFRLHHGMLADARRPQNHAAPTEAASMRPLVRSGSCPDASEAAAAAAAATPL